MSAGLSAPGYRLLMTADTVGGVWQYALDAARSLSDAGVQVALATLGPPPTARQREEAAAIPAVRLIESGEPLDWLCERREEITRAAQTIAALARNLQADIVQLNGTALASEAKFPAPVAVVHHSCLATWWANVKGGDLPEDWLWRRDLSRDHLIRADAIAAPTLAFAEETAATYTLRETPRVLFNGRPQPPGASNGPAMEAVFTAGRLWDEGKNVATLDRAAPTIIAPVLAAGPLEGPQGASVALDAIHALGALSEVEVRTLLARRPVFVSVPLYEPFGLAVLEAAQAGCALILSDIATLRELWDGAAMFVVARDDRALAAACNDLLRDSNLRAHLGAAARERAGRYSASRAAEALLGWHREILARSGALRESAA